MLVSLLLWIVFVLWVVLLIVIPPVHIKWVYSLFLTEMPQFGKFCEIPMIYDKFNDQQFGFIYFPLCSEKEQFF
jgi:hypothetical protein